MPLLITLKLLNKEQESIAFLKKIKLKKKFKILKKI